MKRAIRHIFLTLAVMALWAALMFAGTMYGWWHAPIAEHGGTQVYLDAVKGELDTEFVGNFALAVMEEGQVEAELVHSAGAEVDRNTVFQVASLSKWVSAFGVMKLVEQGLLDLDAPASTYLTRWQLPPSDFDNDQVTVRRILSHTAGLADGLGYSGFEPGTPTQPIEESLTKASDADEGISGSVHVGMEPGSGFEYSGGGYTLLQLLVEEVTGQTFASFMKESILAPLEMNHSSYVWDDTTGLRLAEFYNGDGSEATHYRYTSLAATSLYTSLHDLEVFFQVFLVGNDGEPIGRGVLSPETIRMMREPHAKTMGIDIWGLGTILYAPAENDDFIIGHDGRSTPPINTAVRLDPQSGNGIIVLETGNALLATRLASEWVFWKTGKVDLTLFTMGTDGMKSAVGTGWMVILVGSVLLGVVGFFRKRRRTSPANNS
ncbi:MAG: CubicO group peptidase (beta-lactamase class C family) [Rhodothermales bacterium]|jgi:CubicO group peptidase (beta-lactamase class C family)